MNQNKSASRLSKASFVPYALKQIRRCAQRASATRHCTKRFQYADRLNSFQKKAKRKIKKRVILSRRKVSQHWCKFVKARSARPCTLHAMHILCAESCAKHCALSKAKQICNLLSQNKLRFSTLASFAKARSARAATIHARRTLYAERCN